MNNFNSGKIFTVILICCWAFCARAQNKTQDTLSVSSKLDSIYLLQKKMYAESKNEPLANKKFGIEFNIFRLLVMEKSVNLSGGFLLFSVDRHAEISFPIYYSNPEDAKDLKELTIDCHYRNFLGNTQNGFYLSGFIRYAILRGYLGDNNPFNEETGGKKSSANKLGIGIGLGFRIFSYRGLFWGTSLSFGRYIIGENEKFYGDFLSYDDDQKYIIDFEFLKFGWAF